MSVEAMFAFMINAALLAALTKPMAFTFEGLLIVGLGIGLSIMLYAIGRLDGKRDAGRDK